MFKKVEEQLVRTHITRTILKTAAAGRGMKVQLWDLAEPRTPARDRALAAEIQTWLQAQLAGSATPHGLGGFGITLMWVRMDGAERTWLGDFSPPTFQRTDALAAFEALPQLLTQCAIPPTATHLEVYLLSFGDLIKPAFDH